MSTDPINDFRAAILAVLGHAPEAIEPGKLHRFATSDRRGDEAGWCKLFDDCRGGVFGDWRTGITETWSARPAASMTAAERAALARQVAAARAEREAEERQRHAAAADAARVRWAAAAPVAGRDHHYLVAKSVRAHGLRIEAGHTLLIPMRDADGRLWGVQGIATDGCKRFMPGQRVRGLYLAIGKPFARLVVAEGYATGATIHEETGDAVAVAFNAGNLLPVALALRDKFLRLELIFAADDDWKTPGNPGMTKASEAAAAVGGKVAVPDFTGLPRGEQDSDFNDLARLQRLAKEAV
jgi:putative DNA primase/helicase